MYICLQLKQILFNSNKFLLPPFSVTSVIISVNNLIFKDAITAEWELLVWQEKHIRYVEKKKEAAPSDTAAYIQAKGKKKKKHKFGCWKVHITFDWRICYKIYFQI